MKVFLYSFPPKFIAAGTASVRFYKIRRLVAEADTREKNTLTLSITIRYSKIYLFQTSVKIIISENSWFLDIMEWRCILYALCFNSNRLCWYRIWKSVGDLVLVVQWRCSALLHLPSSSAPILIELGLREDPLHQQQRERHQRHQAHCNNGPDM